MASHLCILAGLLLFVAGYSYGFEHTTDGAGGETCGPQGRKCLASEATCDVPLNKCKCNDPPYSYGNGYSTCYKNNTFRTEVFNDPNVLTYNGNSIGLPLPCRYFWTHTRTYLKNRKREQVGYCEFQAYAFHQKHRGKFYVGGYDVAIKLTYNNGTEKSMSIRKYGKAYYGDYDFYVNGTDDQFLPNGPWDTQNIDFHDPTTNLRINCEFDENNNLAIINAKKCGIRIQFRPYDCGLRRQQPMIPHIAFGVNCAFHPEFLSQDKVVAIPPAANHGGMTIDEVLEPGLDRQETLVYRAIYSMAEQNACPSPNGQCALTSAKLDNCNSVTLVEAFHNCMWILKLPRFIRCWDPTPSGNDIMELFNTCIDVYCNGGSCQTMIDSILSSGCHDITPAYPDVSLFVSGGMCP